MLLQKSKIHRKCVCNINSYFFHILANGIFNRLKTESMEDYLEIFRDFEVKKRDIKPGQTEKTTMRIPTSFVDLLESMTGRSIADTVAMSRYKDRVIVMKDKLRIDSSVIESFFESSISSILDHVEDLLKQPCVQSCKNIVMVGGFSESKLLQARVKQHFASSVLIVPVEADLAVLKGAVIYGHVPSMISERVCKFTYGEKIIWNNCPNSFEIHVRSGQSIKLDEEQNEHIAYPQEADQTSLYTEIYISKQHNPQYVTDPGCTKIGSLTISIPDTSLGTNRKFGTTFLFGGTEIEVKVTDKVSGKVETTRVDFLG